MEDIIKIFHIDWKLLIAQFVNFAIVFGVLYWFALRKLGALMDERSQTIKKGVASAEEAEVLKLEAAELAKAEIGAARKEAKLVMDKAHDDAKAYEAKIKREADEKIASSIARAEKEIADQKAKIMSDSKQSIVALAAGIARQKIGRAHV